MKTNIFLIHTYYHLYLSINLIFDRYKDYNNVIYYTKNHRASRDFSNELPFLEFKYFEKGKFGTKSFLNSLLNYKAERFFFFQENCSESIYLVHKLSKKGVIISLLQDGSKPYHTYKKKRLLYCVLRDTINDYKQMINRRAVVTTVFFHNNYKYAFLKPIKEVWLSYPERFVNRTRKLIIKMPEFSSESIKYLASLFQFDMERMNSECIFYLGENLKKEYVQIENKIVEFIINRYSGVKIFYKMHPNQMKNSPETVNWLRNVKNVEIIADDIPAELYILSMRKGLIISRSSTTMLTNNPRCKYYYTHKLYSGGRLFSQIEMGNPTDYIKEIDNLEEIVM